MYEHPEALNSNIQFNQLCMSRLQRHVFVPELFPTLELRLDKHMVQTNNPRAIELSSPFFFLKMDNMEFSCIPASSDSTIHIIFTQYKNGIHENFM